MSYYRLPTPLKSVVCFSLLLLFSANAQALAPKPMGSVHNHWYFSGMLGYGINGHLKSQRIPTNYSSFNSYDSNGSDNISPFLSLGGGYILPLSPQLSLHSGLSIHVLAPFDETGTISADGAPSSATYSYHVASTALMANASLVYQLGCHQLDALYVRLSMGLSQNRASGYTRVNGAGDASPSMAFTNHTETGLAYGVGLGMQFKINAHWWVGPEYQYWNLGTVSLGQGKNVSGDVRGPLKGGTLNTQGLAIIHATYRF